MSERACGFESHVGQHMTEEEFNKRLKKLELTAEFFDPANFMGRSIRFRHPIIGVIPHISYSQEAVDDLQAIHKIDAHAHTRELAINHLEEYKDLIAIGIIRQGDPDEFFKRFNFGHLEELVEKHPEIAKIVANPKWKPRGASQ